MNLKNNPASNTENFPCALVAFTTLMFGALAFCAGLIGWDGTLTITGILSLFFGAATYGWSLDTNS